MSLATIPEQAVADMRTQLRFTIDPAEGLEQYLGAWAHMLAASNDLIDMIHQHPYRVDEHHMIEFEMVFPRPRSIASGCSSSARESSTPSASTYR